MLLSMLFRISSCSLSPLQDVVGGRFDAGQAFVGELSQVNIWDRVLKPVEVQSMANCSTYVPGNVISWLASSVEVFGRGAFKRPLEMCQERLPNAWNSSVMTVLFLNHWILLRQILWSIFSEITLQNIYFVWSGYSKPKHLQSHHCQHVSVLPEDTLKVNQKIIWMKFGFSIGASIHEGGTATLWDLNGGAEPWRGVQLL